MSNLCVSRALPLKYSVVDIQNPAMALICPQAGGLSTLFLRCLRSYVLFLKILIFVSKESRDSTRGRPAPPQNPSSSLPTRDTRSLIFYLGGIVLGTLRTRWNGQGHEQRNMKGSKLYTVIRRKARAQERQKKKGTNLDRVTRAGES